VEQLVAARRWLAGQAVLATAQEEAAQVPAGAVAGLADGRDNDLFARHNEGVLPSINAGTVCGGQRDGVHNSQKEDDETVGALSLLTEPPGDGTGNQLSASTHPAPRTRGLLRDAKGLFRPW
jgi:hypothetical protein